MMLYELDDVEKSVLLSGVSICALCEANAKWNEAGGYHDLAEQCREYCRRSHKEATQRPGEKVQRWYCAGCNEWHEASVLGGAIGGEVDANDNGN